MLNNRCAAIRLNVRGREPYGCVEPGAEADALVEELRGELLAPYKQEVARSSRAPPIAPFSPLPPITAPVWTLPARRYCLASEAALQSRAATRLGQPRNGRGL